MKNFNKYSGINNFNLKNLFNYFLLFSLFTILSSLVHANCSKSFINPLVNFSVLTLKDFRIKLSSHQTDVVPIIDEDLIKDYYHKEVKSFGNEFLKEPSTNKLTKLIR